MSESQQLTPQQRGWVERAVDRVEILARKIARSTGFASEDELRSAGHEALVRSALRYDPASGVPFSAFAHYRIRGAMLDTIRRASPTLRAKSRALRALETTQSLLEQRHLASAARETADPRSLSERVQAAADLLAQATAAVVLAKRGNDDPDALAAKVESPEAAVLDKESKALLEAAITGLTEAEQAIVDAVYHRGLSMGEYAAEAGRNKSSISRLHGKLLTKLSKRLADLRRVRRER